MSSLHLTVDNFDQTVGSGRMLVDFWADWCMPCRMVSPVIEELAEEYKDKVTVAKVNIDSESVIAARFGIRNIPTVILFDDGLEVKRFVGVKPKEVYAAEL